MNMHDPAFSTTERLAYPIFTSLAGRFDPICQKTFFDFHQLGQGESRTIETAYGSYEITGRLRGTGRVADVSHAGHNQCKITFAHGKFASLFTYRIVQFRWDSAASNLPTVFAPNNEMLSDFFQDSFTVRLFPRMLNREQIAIPKIYRGQVLHYDILTLDAEATEGVAIRLESA